MGALPHGYSIRSAKRDEFPLLQRIERSANLLFDGTGLIEDPYGEPIQIPIAAFEQAAKKDLLLVVADPFDTPVAFALCSTREPDLYLDQISVSMPHARQGIGTSLMEAVIAKADELQMRGVLLSTFRDVEWNGPFYAKLGFSELPRSKVNSWMRRLEDIQAQTMDIELRCFMRRPGKCDKSWIRKSS